MEKKGENLRKTTATTTTEGNSITTMKMVPRDSFSVVSSSSSSSSSPSSFGVHHSFSHRCYVLFCTEFHITISNANVYNCKTAPHRHVPHFSLVCASSFIFPVHFLYFVWIVFASFSSFSSYFSRAFFLSLSLLLSCCSPVVGWVFVYCESISAVVFAVGGVCCIFFRSFCSPFGCSFHSFYALALLHDKPDIEYINMCFIYENAVTNRVKWHPPCLSWSHIYFTNSQGTRNGTQPLTRQYSNMNRVSWELP